MYNSREAPDLETAKDAARSAGAAAVREAEAQGLLED